MDEPNTETITYAEKGLGMEELERGGRLPEHTWLCSFDFKSKFFHQIKKTSLQTENKGEEMYPTSHQVVGITTQRK